LFLLPFASFVPCKCVPFLHFYNFLSFPLVLSIPVPVFYLSFLVLPCLFVSSYSFSPFLSYSTFLCIVFPSSFFSFIICFFSNLISSCSCVAQSLQCLTTD
jgi:hypothetical protein